MRIPRWINRPESGANSTRSGRRSLALCPDSARSAPPSLPASLEPLLSCSVPPPSLSCVRALPPSLSTALPPYGIPLPSPLPPLLPFPPFIPLPLQGLSPVALSYTFPPLIPLPPFSPLPAAPHPPPPGTVVDTRLNCLVTLSYH